MSKQHIEASAAKSTSALGITHQRSKTGHHLAPIGKTLPAAVVIESEGYVAKVGQAVGAAFGVVIDAGPLVVHKNGGVRTGSVRHSEMADHRDAIYQVTDF